MIDTWPKAEDARRTAAADWVVRLQSDDVSDADLAAFDSWIAASPRHAEAYDSALDVMMEIQAKAAAIARGLTQPVAREAYAAPARRRRPPESRTRWIAAGGLAAAAAVALAVNPFGAPGVATQTYVTAKGEHRAVQLADGSTIDMNAGSRLTVTLGKHDRRVLLPEGEAVFDVAHDAARPFLISAGDRTVRVVGTRFDVRERSGALSVTVERGMVEVRPAEGASGRAWRLRPGQRLDHVEGAPAAAISAADPAQVTSWRTGRLVYRDQPLSDVVADLNQQFAKPIRLDDPALGATRFSGVLVLDDQAAVIRRLALLAPLSTVPSPREILLQRDRAPKP